MRLLTNKMMQFFSVYIKSNIHVSVCLIFYSLTISFKNDIHLKNTYIFLMFLFVFGAYNFIKFNENKFTNENLLVFEGEGNKPTLVNGLRAHTKEIISLSLYIRRYQKLPDLVSFYHKVISKNTLIKDAIDFNKQVFLLLSSSSIANLAKKELKKQKVMLNSLVVLSHHDRIIEVMKEECHDLTFSKIISLSPKLIADEVKKRLV